MMPPRPPASCLHRRITGATRSRPAQALTVAAGDDTGGSTGVIEEVVAQGGGLPLHIHHADELFCVLSGRFAFRIGDLRATGGVGTVAFTPRGTAHTWMNARE